MPSMEEGASAPVTTLAEIYDIMRARWAEGDCAPTTPDVLFDGICSTRSVTQADMLAKVGLILELLEEELAPESGAIRMARSLRDDLLGDSFQEAVHRTPPEGAKEAMVAARDLL